MTQMAVFIQSSPVPPASFEAYVWPQRAQQPPTWQTAGHSRCGGVDVDVVVWCGLSGSEGAWWSWGRGGGNEAKGWAGLGWGAGKVLPATSHRLPPPPPTAVIIIIIIIIIIDRISISISISNLLRCLWSGDGWIRPEGLTAWS
ncbi:hypothetical protein BO82DRAFT_202807 [Aspergillus uvarum CBS 121591]|uniref:Uncharacterized protein n=1 Tax=Aspergillus uvarum CBS 121591 TaxID=1448315 RepID=A0A319BWH8_9EURO|nr:hypothetical protein BO82DRAFT_202807 [Aspergillus uvarum CBS 121591]PYH76577.1 hypothetical protein BO82DRAFT_202807 [Aspergillus uvarum CBS 121591]